MYISHFSQLNVNFFQQLHSRLLTVEKVSLINIIPAIQNTKIHINPKPSFYLYYLPLRGLPRDLGPVSRKPRKLSEPVKPFLVHLYLKTEKCIRLKRLV